MKARNHRRLITCSLLAALVAGSSSAFADGTGTVALSVDRAFGLVSTNTDTEGTDSNTTRFSLLWGASTSPYSRPRVGIDYFVSGGLSIGGALGFYTTSSSVEDNDTGSGSGFLFSPRVGYLLGLSDTVAFWPRGGFTFVNEQIEDEDGDELSDSASALTLEAPLLVRLGSVALSIAFTIDLGLGGEMESDLPSGMTVTTDQEHDELGLQFGLVGFL